MSAVFLEFHLKGGGCALIEAGTICGAVAKGHDAYVRGTPDAPTAVIIRGGETLEVIGDGPAHVIARMVTAKHYARNTPGLEVHVDWLEPLGGGDDTGDSTGA